MAPAWLTAVSWLAIGVAIVCAAGIDWDEWVRGRRQQMRVMERSGP